ncbi:type II secretion system F family protein [Clostridioides sp. ZZV15-6383]|uniref:type II secretion system F family protein n=1 Tax=unclassified Clostridioides TaxID=2635829 RepID=UPI0006BBE11D|nr:type II secretion system protein F [Clostridioides difficile]MCC0684823.1 type II secretion system F family protein [Clostridioides sp. ZZV14-6345]MCC0699186.1 type II secretion system F family protein [Clostridioides sp. ZZV15-6383]
MRLSKSIFYNLEKFYLVLNRISDKEVRVICKEIGILLESGCEITKIFEIIESQSSKKVKKLLNIVSNHIQKGNSISESFQITGTFSKFFISMVKAGETSGNLDIIMSDLSNYYDKEYKLKTKVVTISIYPIILIALSIISMIFIFIFVIPNFQVVFASNGIEPPLITKVLMEMSTIVTNNLGYLTFSFILFLIGAIYFLITNNSVKRLINSLKFKLPFVRRINQLVATTRFSRALSILISSGIQIVEAIDMSASVIDNEFIYERLKISNNYIKKGNGIGKSLNLANIFPKLFISMANTGEESGKLDKSLDVINKFYENELNNKIEQIMKFIEPMLIVFMGLIIGTFILAMVIPMFDAITSF